MDTSERKETVFEEIERLRTVIQQAIVEDQEPTSMRGRSVYSLLVEVLRNIIPEPDQALALEARLKYLLHTGEIDPYDVVAIYKRVVAKLPTAQAGGAALLDAPTSNSVSDGSASDVSEREWDLELLQKPIGHLGLDIRAERPLEKWRADTLGKIAQLTETDLLDVRDCGPMTVDRIERALDIFGLTLGMSFPPNIVEKIGKPERVYIP